MQRVQTSISFQRPWIKGHWDDFLSQVAKVYGASIFFITGKKISFKNLEYEKENGFNQYYRLHFIMSTKKGPVILNRQPPQLD